MHTKKRDGHYLSWIWEAICANNIFIVVNRCFWVSWFVLVFEINVIKSKSFRETFVPFKLIQQRPGSIASYINTVI